MYTPDAVNHVQLRNPTSVLEAANQLQDFYKSKQQWKDKRQYRSRFYECNDSGGPRDEGEHGETVQTGGDGRGELHGSGHGQRYGNKWVKQNSSARQEFSRERDEKEGSGSRGPVCFGCGKKGHKKSECPNRIARVTSPVRLAMFT